MGVHGAEGMFSQFSLRTETYATLPIATPYCRSSEGLTHGHRALAVRWCVGRALEKLKMLETHIFGAKDVKCRQLPGPRVIQFHCTLRPWEG